MDTSQFHFLLALLFSSIGVCDGTIQSGYWSKEWNHHWHNTTGEVLYTTTARRLSDCASICQDSISCLRCGYSPDTGTCHGFTHLEINPVSILDTSEVIYKHSESCTRAGYVLLANGPLCVKKHGAALSWDDAKTQCEQDHGRLAVIDNAQKYGAFVSYLDNISSGAVWVGINDKVTEGAWVWLNGASLNTVYWSSRELNDYSSGYLPNKYTAECAWIDKLGHLADDHCLMTKSYMCEREDLV